MFSISSHLFPDIVTQFLDSVRYLSNEIVPSIFEVGASHVAMAAFEVGLIFRMDWILAAEQVSEHNTTGHHFGSAAVEEVVPVALTLLRKLLGDRRVSAKNPAAALVVKRRTRIRHCCRYLPPTQTLYSYTLLLRIQPFPLHISLHFLYMARA